MDRRALFVIRQLTTVRWHPLREAKTVGRVATGEVWEQPIEDEDTGHGERRKMRRVVLRLDTRPTTGMRRSAG
jgi:hypothetical protein